MFLFGKLFVALNWNTKDLPKTSFFICLKRFTFSSKRHNFYHRYNVAICKCTTQRLYGETWLNLHLKDTKCVRVIHFNLGFFFEFVKRTSQSAETIILISKNFVDHLSLNENVSQKTFHVVLTLSLSV